MLWKGLLKIPARVSFNVDFLGCLCHTASRRFFKEFFEFMERFACWFTALGVAFGVFSDGAAMCTGYGVFPLVERHSIIGSGGSVAKGEGQKVVAADVKRGKGMQEEESGDCKALKCVDCKAAFECVKRTVDFFNLRRFALGLISGAAWEMILSTLFGNSTYGLVLEGLACLGVPKSLGSAVASFLSPLVPAFSAAFSVNVVARNVESIV